jgi:hypothetical protein
MLTPKILTRGGQQCVKSKMAEIDIENLDKGQTKQMQMMKHIEQIKEMRKFQNAPVDTMVNVFKF